MEQTDAILSSWSRNADLWTHAVRDGAITSRREATDAAILAAVRRAAPRRLLDVGCGEGWLCRAIGATGVEVVGIDGSAELVARAVAAGGATFHTLGYAELIAAPDVAGHGYDTLVCNFALLDARADALVAALARIAAPNATLLIQTVHPLAAGAPYEDGWRLERFETFGGGADWHPMPWYFRTLASWVAVLSAHWQLRVVEEPRASGAALPASLLLGADLRPGALTRRQV